MYSRTGVSGRSRAAEIGASRFYHARSISAGANASTDQSGEDSFGSSTGQFVQAPRPLGVLQALSLDRAGSSSNPNYYRNYFLKQQLSSCNAMYSSDVLGHHGCVNALAFSSGEEQFLGTGMSYQGRTRAYECV